MANITIRNLPDDTKNILRVRAAEHGMSLEGYVRDLLQQESARASVPAVSIAESARRIFGPKHGIEPEGPGV